MGKRDKLPVEKGGKSDSANAITVVEYGKLVYAIGNEAKDEYIRFLGETPELSEMR